MADLDLFSSESVTEGHPDKLADAVSDAVLDLVLTQTPKARVAVETLLGHGFAVVAGEVTPVPSAEAVEKVLRDVVRDCGYTADQLGFNCTSCKVDVRLHGQSSDIAVGVDDGGAGDQGMMFGYACRETPELMPLPITVAHALTAKLASVRRAKPELGLRPDGKSQVTVGYEKGLPKRIAAVVIATQHDEGMSLGQVREIVDAEVVKPVLAEYPDFVDDDLYLVVNGTGVFIVGGPEGDTGVTGRKIIVDTYGGMARHGGGAFSGKDPTKVDRSASYLTRYIAKNVVAAELAERCEIQLAYAIGKADPMSVRVDTFGTGRVSDEKLLKAVKEVFPLTPGAIIKLLDLQRPIYRQTALNGHFGKPGFPWEATDKASDLSFKVA
ncbi:MAG TPA: methionine adenosyltransferase [Armatimonadota bacterium]|jgi:S-adenosylmethionine synthetase